MLDTPACLLTLAEIEATTSVSERSWLEEYQKSGETCVAVDGAISGGASRCFLTPNTTAFRVARVLGHYEVGDFGEIIEVGATQVQIVVPYDGEQELWHVRASTYNLSGYPELDITPHLIKIPYTIMDSDAARSANLKADVDRVINSLVDALNNLARDVEAHNNSTPAVVVQALAGMRRTAESASSAISSLGIPMRKRDQPLTYAVPTKRRASPVARPAASTQAYVREPVLSIEEYEHILTVLKLWREGALENEHRADIRTDPALLIQRHGAQQRA